jgi:hypothetical protein
MHPVHPLIVPSSVAGATSNVSQVQADAAKLFFYHANDCVTVLAWTVHDVAKVLFPTNWRPL